MDKVKKEFVLLGGLLVILLIGINNYSGSRYSYANLGVTPPLKADCSALKDSGASPTTISFHASDVALIHGQIKDLIKKHDGELVNDSLSSYSTYIVPEESALNASADVSASIEAAFETASDDFLTELTALVKAAGGMDSDYSYADGSSYDMAFSPYSSCVGLLRNVMAGKLELEMLTRALQKEGDPSQISLLSQLISDARMGLQSEIDALNSAFVSQEKPSVSISIYTKR